jgi:hypothetical protein
MGIKVGILHETGHCDDLGEVDLQKRTSTPGTDSARIAEEYGWECLFEDTSAIYASKEPERTDELRYMFVIEVTDMADACGGECERTKYASDLIEGKEFDTKEEIVKALMALPDREQRVLEYLDPFEDDVPNDDDVLDWARNSVDERTYNEIVTTLYVVPVSGTAAFVEKATGDNERFAEAKEAFAKDGDWRDSVEDIHGYGAHVPVGSWSSFMPAGEWAPKDLLTAKMMALQVKMLFGFYMDQVVNRIGETGWDWIRQAGVFFPGDSVEYEKDESGPQWYEIDEIEDGIAYLLDRDQKELQVPLEKLVLPTWAARLRHGRDKD